jgi:hypothetical protein
VQALSHPFCLPFVSPTALDAENPLQVDLAMKVFFFPFVFVVLSRLVKL